MAHDVFVSYSNKDKVIADTIVTSLERNNVRCWYAPRDINPSDDWGDAISEAITESKIFLIIFSGNANHSRHVLDELILAVDEEIAILPFRVENLKPKGAMRLHLSSRHWLDAYEPSWEENIQKLVKTVCKTLDIPDGKEIVGKSEKVIQAPRKPEKKKFTKYIAPAGLGAVLLIAGWFVWNQFFRESLTVKDIEPETAEVIPTQIEASEIIPTHETQQVQSSLGEWNEECQIAYSGLSRDTFSIWIMDPDGSNQKPLTSDEFDDIYPKWSPNGEKIGFISGSREDDNISLIDLNWAEALPFTENRVSNKDNNNYQFEWSPVSEDMIAYVSQENGNDDVFISAFGSYDKSINIDLANDTNPAWSPDGQKLAFVSDRDGNKDIFLVDPDGENLSVLTNNSADDVEPAWSPDGEKIAFASDRNGKFDIFTINADGSNLVLITKTGHNRYPTWSHDGSIIAFYSDRGGNFDVYVINEDGSGIKKLIDATPGKDEFFNEYNSTYYSFSPDDTEIVFSKGSGIFLMDIDGENIRHLGHGFHPVWSPICKREDF